MILTLTPNPALDVTYEIDRLTPHQSHRVLQVHELAGGKGINVASVLTGQQHECLAMAPVGGDSGRAFAADLDRRGVAYELIATRRPTRRTVTVVSRADGEATAFNEPGAPVDQAAWAILETRLGEVATARAPRVVAISGSVPPGMPADGLSRLVHRARATGARVVVDASREALLEAVTARPDLIKPNRHELTEATGLADPIAGAKALQDNGAQHVLVSLGPDGVALVAATGEVIRAALGRHLPGNPTGAGDAAVAAACAGLVSGEPDWSSILANVVAWSAAAVLAPVAGQVDPAAVAQLRADIKVWKD